MPHCKQGPRGSLARHEIIVMISRLMRLFAKAAGPARPTHDSEDMAMRRGAFQNSQKEKRNTGLAGVQTPPPRWMVVFGVIAYCTCAWIALFHFGGQATTWLANMMNSDTLQAATKSEESTR